MIFSLTYEASANHRLSINVYDLSWNHLTGIVFDDGSLSYWGPDGNFKWRIYK